MDDEHPDTYFVVDTDKEKNRQSVAKRIEDLIVAETLSSQALCNTLFTPNGLFSQMADTEEERRELVRSPLFQRALERYLILKYERVRQLRMEMQKRRMSPT